MAETPQESIVHTGFVVGPDGETIERFARIPTGTFVRGAFVVDAHGVTTQQVVRSCG